VIVLVLSLSALLVAGAGLAAATGDPDESRTTRAVRVFIWAFATLIVTETALGTCGRLDGSSTLIALAIVAAAVAIGTRGRTTPMRTAERAPLSAIDLLFAYMLAVALPLRLWAGLNKTTFLYDTLSYHLHTPATWLADHRLEIVPAVFGDPSPAYAPSNLELWFAFLMAPLGSDYLAGTGQVAFALLGTLAVIAAVREGGGSRMGGLVAALVFFWVPEIWQQGRTAMTDLGMAALLLATLPLIFRMKRRTTSGDLATSAAALGLAAGTKYAAALLAAPFVVAVVLATVKQQLPRRRQLAAVAAIFVATGGFWYARNLWLTGNPFYPVAAFGFPGLYGRAAMRAWTYHLPLADLRAFAEMWLAAGIAFSVAGAAVLVSTRHEIETPLTVALLALFWCAIPYQESRFLFAVFGVVAVALGRAATRSTSLPLRYAAGVALVGAVIESPAEPERWWPALAGVLGLAASLAWDHLPARARRPLAGVAALAVLGGGSLALAHGLGRYRAADPGYGIGTDIDDVWTWFRANVRGARVAYTGTNIGFPLTGRDLSNRVEYVNVAGAPGDRLHDFGQRLPPGERAATPEPAPYRAGADFDVWLRNLRAAGAEVLFVAALDEIVTRNVAADADGFPVERTWADAHPALFHLRYASPAARVYGIAP
jgi:4-amino-4-deoxy-L-arabinose transferase-like glycosyltransferase